MPSKIKQCIQEAIEVERFGLKIPLKIKTETSIPVEFQERLHALPLLKSAFLALTPGRQRAYTYYFSAPKQFKTGRSTIEKCTGHMLKGKELY